MNIHQYITVIAASLFIVVENGFAENFPLRDSYKSVNTVSTENLAESYGKTFIIDVRTAFEYSVMHINRAKNIPFADDTFPLTLGELVQGQLTSAITLYGNGKFDSVPYDAAMILMKNGFTNVTVYDSGVHQWVLSYSAWTTLLGESPVRRDLIIPYSKFVEKSLQKGVFEKKAQTNNSYIIDIRRPQEKKINPSFSMPVAHIPYDYFIKMVESPSFKERVTHKTLFIFDSDGFKTRLIQYYLEYKGYEHYYFLSKGVNSF